MSVPQEDIDHVLNFILPYIQADGKSQPSNYDEAARFTRRPFTLGLTGLQGSGKSTWTWALGKTLRESHGLNTINVSIDDLYRDHEGLVHPQQRNPDNKLLRTRGQPGTHDEELAYRFFQSLTAGSSEGIKIPAFEKARHHGEGDRVPSEEWEYFPPGTVIDVIIFEGWCLGFRPLSETALEIQWKMARAAALPDQKGAQDPSAAFTTGTLGTHPLEHLLIINENLGRYCDTFTGPQHLDYLVHLDTDDLANVYAWRMQQEHALRKTKGGGMSDEEVVMFVQSYMPAYELYLNPLRQGLFTPVDSDDGQMGKEQLRVLMDRARVVVKVERVEPSKLSRK